MRLGKGLLKSAVVRESLSLVVALYIRLVYATVRWRYVDHENLGDLLAAGEGTIPLLWHGRLLIGPKAWRWKEPMSVLISRHGDGDIIARTVGRLGVGTVRGSTERADKERDKGGAAAVRQMLKLLKQKHSTSLTPDGPRGPRMQLSRGVAELARLSGAAVIPVSYATRRRVLLRSWDRFHLALPFCAGVIVYGKPIRVPRRLDEAGREAARQEIEAALNAVTWQADRLAGHAEVQPAAQSERRLQEGRA